MRWETDTPVQKDAYIGPCPMCGKEDSLLFLLEDMKGEYEHCMFCNGEWPTTKQ